MGLFAALFLVLRKYLEHRCTQKYLWNIYMSLYLSRAIECVIYLVYWNDFFGGGGV